MAVDVGSAVGYLDLDINGFLSGLRSAQSEADSATKNMATKIGGGLKTVGDKMSKLGGLATTSITVPIVTAVTASVKQFAKLEQSVGGVETLFKSSAKTVINNAEKAYKTAGVDANSYMEQVTSFSATLLQGLGGDTEKAASYADKAIIDMSDNANKMGTNIGMIQEAYQGFAKDNYTMLDNLKLGYGGTAEEMARLVNESGVMNGEFEVTAENVKDIPFSTLIDAIHITQENLGITGTTAKEAAETVSGSFQMAASSVQNFLQQLGNPGADMDRFASEMIKSIGVFVENVKRVLLTIWDNLPISPLQKKLIVAAAAFGPITFATGKIVSAVGSITLGVSKAIPIISKFASGFASAGTALGDGASKAEIVGAAIGGISAPVAAIIAVIAVLIAAFVTLWKTNEDFRNKMTAIWDGIKEKFENFFGAIQERLPELQEAFTNIVNVIKPIWEGFCEILAPIFEGAFEIISTIIGTVLDIIIGLLDIFIGVFTGNWDKVWQGVKEIFGGIWDGIVNLFTTAIDILKGLFDVVCGWFGTTWDNTWNAIKQFFADTWNAIINFFVNIGTTMTTAVSNFITAIINFFMQLPTNIANFITTAFNAVVTWATNMVTKASEMGTNFLNAVVEFFMQLPTNIANFITSAFNAVVTWATNMVTKASEMGTNFINSVVSFFTQLPGKVLQFITSALDNVKTWATNMATKASEMGTNFINNVVSFLTQLPGKVKDFLDSAIENVKTWVTQMGQKGQEAITELINSIVSTATAIPGKMAEIGDNIVQGVWNGIKSAASWFTDKVGGFFSGIVDGVKGVLGIGSPSKVMADQVGKWMPAGVATGFEKAMPAAMRNIQAALNKGIDSVEADDISISAKTNVESFSNKLKNIYEGVATWFETIEYRIGGSIDRMTESLASLIQMGGMVVNSDGTLGYVGYNGFGSKPQPNQMPTNPTRGDNDSGGDTYNFYSPKPIDEIEVARQLKKTKRDLSEGF